MTEKQRLKMQLLEKFAISDEPKSVDFCHKAYDFLAEDEVTAQPQTGAASQEPDGIYLVLNNGKHVLFTGDNTKEDCTACIGIGVKWGERSIIVALRDEANGKDITLTEDEDTTDYDGYIDNYLDAVADWDGKANTEHLKETGLNEQIKLPDNWYIPSLGEMYFIFLNRKAINKALAFVGGLPMGNLWYWTSAESSATIAWHLYLSNGYAYYYTKASTTYRVRAVSAFIKPLDFNF